MSNPKMPKAAKTLYLLLDTNVFIECRPLKDLGWEQWADEFDEIHLIVSYPVQREIDNQKDRGNDRVGRRAREIAPMFKKIIVGTESYELIREAKPQVKLLVDSSCRPDPDLKDELSDSVDDQIVACLSAFRKALPGKDAYLLTHDVGPMGTAKRHSLPFIPVPEEWRRPPETTKEEKENKRLKAELERLRETEPQFQIRCVDEEDKPTNSLSLEYVRFDPLSDEDIEELMNQLKEQFPVATDFGRKKPFMAKSQMFPSMITAHIPAPDEEIANYKTQHMNWLNQCEKYFRNLHKDLQCDPEFCFAILNEGTRPGNDVLVALTAKGNIQICPPAPENENGEEENGANQGSGLPSPPTPPKRKWRATLPTAFSLLQPGKALQYGRRENLPISFLDKSLPLLTGQNRRDPNAFYYKPARPSSPVTSFELECEQWRHGMGDKLFYGEVFFNPEATKFVGALECAIHAENLSRPVKKEVKVTITITEASTKEHAEKLIEALALQSSTPSP